ncbi:hypothetical protein B0I35DRAFT_413341 [Stachybotrys elegans]|uniref:Myb-like domain-containing protein n=1 Tax=Stachybotrys elegans TaxID=80388 RepID=A0A8K0SGZ4_9HYPO|nr:hypothetical protein B0I35DRAFT_413341 [Stachybotrys elegans]
MSPPHVSQLAAAFTPVSDAIDRHESGVSKCRKAASTGGGRAWSEEEEVYLLQTRLQKMPYKHIAAHLKKTELACRLHYHQLSHGSNRRKRTPSCSSGSEGSPMPATMTSPGRDIKSRSLSPPGSSYGMPPNAMHLPSIMSEDGSPKLPAILPKPVSMDMSRGMTPPHMYPGQADRRSSLPHASFHAKASTPPLRLDCSALPPPASISHTAAHVDLNRLHHIYSTHRASFWNAVASEYGSNATPMMLEQAWKTGICCPQTMERGGSPMTPAASPSNSEREGYIRSQDKTRISSILDNNADPRSAHDRDMVRRMDEQRFSMAPSV